jgi:hypothetical protein
MDLTEKKKKKKRQGRPDLAGPSQIRAGSSPADRPASPGGTPNRYGLLAARLDEDLRAGAVVPVGLCMRRRGSARG